MSGSKAEALSVNEQNAERDQAELSEAEQCSLAQGMVAEETLAEDTLAEDTLAEETLAEDTLAEDTVAQWGASQCVASQRAAIQYAVAHCTAAPSTGGLMRIRRIGADVRLGSVASFDSQPLRAPHPNPLPHNMLRRECNPMPCCLAQHFEGARGLDSLTVSSAQSAGVCQPAARCQPRRCGDRPHWSVPGRLLGSCVAWLVLWMCGSALSYAGDEVAAKTEQGSAAQRGEESTSLLPLIEASDRILFLGDSITWAAEYVTYFELWLAAQPLRRVPQVIDAGLPSETVSGLSEEGHAGGAFPRPDLHERLARVLETTRPNLVFACYGMNCGIYQAWDESRFARYRQGIERLREAVSARGAQLVLITPPYYDRQQTGLAVDYNEVLGRYGEWLLSQRGQGWKVLDLHGPMTAEVNRRRQGEPQFTFQPDGVHPNSQGQWFVAQQLLEACGEKRSSTWQSPAEMLAALQLDEAALKLAERRTVLLRDAYVGAAGHQRPGIEKGLPLPEADAQAGEITQQLSAIIKATRSNK